jgi:hypothetical protein
MKVVACMPDAGWWPCGVPRPVYLWPGNSNSTDDCDCNHPRDDHPGDGPCRAIGCACNYYDDVDTGPWW